MYFHCPFIPLFDRRRRRREKARVREAEREREREREGGVEEGKEIRLPARFHRAFDCLFQ